MKQNDHNILVQSLLTPSVVNCSDPFLGRLFGFSTNSKTAKTSFFCQLIKDENRKRSEPL